MSVGSFLNDVATEMIYPLLPVFLTKVLGATFGFVGVIEGIAESTSSVAKLLSGWYSDRRGSRKAPTVAGYALSGLTRPLVAVAGAPWHVLLARFTDRIGKGVRTSPRDALLAASVDPKIRGKAFGFHRAMDNAGALVGPAISMLILWWKPGMEHYRLVFWIACVPTAIAVLILWRWIREVPPDKKGASGAPSLSWSALDRSFRAYVIVMFIFTLGNSSDAFLLLRAEKLGVPDYLLPLLWIVLNFTKTITNIPGGGLADRWGRKKVIIIGWVVYSLIYAGFAAAGAIWHAWALFALYGIYFGMTEGAERALVSDLAPDHIRGTAYGFFHLSVGLAAFPASALFGYLWDKVGVEIAFGTGAGFATLAAILMAFLVRPAKR